MLTAEYSYADDIAVKIEEAEERGIILGEKRGEKRGIALGEKRGIILGEKRGKKQGIALGEKRGERTHAIVMAKRMLKKDYDIETIAYLSGLSVNTVKKIKLRLENRDKFF